MNKNPEQEIIDSWQTNASPWTNAVRADQIESRRLVTNRTIVETLLRYRPQTVLDIGCGEGWLARKLAAHGMQITGIDVVPALIENAKKLGGGNFFTYSYEQIADDILARRFDAAVCNFSLLGKESVDMLIQSAPALLTSGGHIFIQTLHPLPAGGEMPYEDGWRTGSWTGFSADFSDPAPWYFRTISSWIKLLRAGGLNVVEILEPLHPQTQKPASILFVSEN